MKSISYLCTRKQDNEMIMEFLKTNNKTVYSGILVVLTVCLLLGERPHRVPFDSFDRLAA